MDENKNFIETLGAQFSDPDVRDYRIAKSSLKTEFPAEFELTMPPVHNQDSVSSCVAHSISLVAEYYNKEQHDIDEPLSAGYIYGNRNALLGHGQGMITRLAISNFCADGTPYKIDFPDHYEVPEIIDAVKARKEELADKAEQFRFTAYLKTGSKEEIKTALMAGTPVIIAVDWQKDMCYRNGEFYSTYLYGKSGGHAMVIYGWNERGWKVQNSWGVEWGNKGTAVWPYYYRLRETYAIIDEATTLLTINKPYATKSKFAKFFIRGINKLYAFFYNLKHKTSK